MFSCSPQPIRSIFLIGLASFSLACSENSSPVAPEKAAATATAASSDSAAVSGSLALAADSTAGTTTLWSVLDQLLDPFFTELPGYLADQAAAQPIRDRATAVVTILASRDALALKSALELLHTESETYRTAHPLDAGDEVMIDATEHIGTLAREKIDSSISATSAPPAASAPSDSIGSAVPAPPADGSGSVDPASPDGETTDPTT